MVQSQQAVLRMEDARLLVAQAFDDGIAAMRTEQQQFMYDLLKQLQGAFRERDAASNGFGLPVIPEEPTSVLPVVAEEAVALAHGSKQQWSSEASGSSKGRNKGSIQRLDSKNRFVIVGHQGATDQGVDWASLPMAWPHQSEAELNGGTPEEIATQSRCFTKTKRFVASPLFESLFGIVIILNLITMCVRTQYRETHTAYALGLRDDDSTWQDNKIVFEELELVYSTLYIIELLMRAYFLGCLHFTKFWNFLDAIIVLVTSVDFFVTAVAGWSSEGMWLPVARLFRIARVARFAKIVRIAQVFGELRVIIRTLTASVRGLLWAVLLVFVIILAGGILITQLLAGFMEDKDNVFNERLYMYERYGSAFKATFTMWGHTFTGRWTDDARRMTERVDGMHALFWIVWIVGVNFAVMRVIAALFLKQTLAVANDDAQKMALQKIKERDHFINIIREIFHTADVDGGGSLSAEEFVNMIKVPTVAENFKLLDLELFEVTMLFRLLADDNGEADYDEFLQGAIQLKGTARNIDVIKILHETIKIRKHLAHLELGLYDSFDSRAQPFKSSVMINLPQRDFEDARIDSTDAVEPQDPPRNMNSQAMNEPSAPTSPSTDPQWTLHV